MTNKAGVRFTPSEDDAIRRWAASHPWDWRGFALAGRELQSIKDRWKALCRDGASRERLRDKKRKARSSCASQQQQNLPGAAPENLPSRPDLPSQTANGTDAASTSTAASPSASSTSPAVITNLPTPIATAPGNLPGRPVLPSRIADGTRIGDLSTTTATSTTVANSPSHPFMSDLESQELSDLDVPAGPCPNDLRVSSNQTTVPEYSRDQDCPGKHGLVSFSAPDEAWCCGVCDRNVRKGSMMHGCRSCDYDVCEACLKRRECCHEADTWLPIADGRSWVELHTPTSTVARAPVENDLINGSWNVDDAFALIDASDHDRHLPLTHAKLPHDNLLARVICAPETLVQHSPSCLLSSATGPQNGGDAEVCGQCLDAFDQHEEWLGDATVPAYSRDQDCPGKHGLVSFSTTPDMAWCCGICARNMPKGSMMHGCESCNYDVCDACFKPRASGSEDEQPSWEVMRGQLAVTAEFRRASVASVLGLSQTRSPSGRAAVWSMDVHRGILPHPYFAHYTPQTGQLLDNAIIGHAASEFVRDGVFWVAKSHLAIAIDEDVCEIGIKIPSAAHIAEWGMVELQSANVQRSLASNEPPKVLFLSDCGFCDHGFLPSRKKCGCSQFDEDIRGGLIGFVRLCKRLVGGSSLANCKAMANSLGVRDHFLERNYRLLQEGKITGL